MLGLDGEDEDEDEDDAVFKNLVAGGCQSFGGGGRTVTCCVPIAPFLSSEVAERFWLRR